MYVFPPAVQCCTVARCVELIDFCDDGRFYVPRLMWLGRFLAVTARLFFSTYSDVKFFGLLLSSFQFSSSAFHVTDLLTLVGEFVKNFIREYSNEYLSITFRRNYICTTPQLPYNIHQIHSATKPKRKFRLYPVPDNFQQRRNLAASRAKFERVVVGGA